MELVTELVMEPVDVRGLAVVDTQHMAAPRLLSVVAVVSPQVVAVVVAPGQHQVKQSLTVCQQKYFHGCFSSDDLLRNIAF